MDLIGGLFDGSGTDCHPGRLKQWAQMNLMRLNKAKCRVLHLGHVKPSYQYKLGDVRMEDSPDKKDLGGREYCIQMGSPQHRRDVDLLECVQRRATKMIQGMKHVPCKVRLRELKMFSLEKRRLWEWPFST